jgi:hypothetical protein
VTPTLLHKPYYLLRPPLLLLLLPPQCALHPDMRTAWAEGWAQLLHAGGELVTMVYPVDPSRDANRGPPWPVTPELYKQLLPPAGGWLFVAVVVFLLHALECVDCAAVEVCVACCMAGKGGCGHGVLSRDPNHGQSWPVTLALYKQLLPPAGEFCAFLWKLGALFWLLCN